MIGEPMGSPFVPPTKKMKVQTIHSVQFPVHPRDVLPLLPRQVSWPVLNSLHGAADLLPAFVGSASAKNGTGEWKGVCFYKNRAWMEFHNKSGSEFGGGTLHIEVKNKGVSIFLCKLECWEPSKHCRCLSFIYKYRMG